MWWDERFIGFDGDVSQDSPKARKGTELNAAVNLDSEYIRSGPRDSLQCLLKPDALVICCDLPGSPDCYVSSSDI